LTLKGKSIRSKNMKIRREQYEQIKGHLPVERGNVKIDKRD
jgi:hypothetical protein